MRSRASAADSSLAVPAASTVLGADKAPALQRSDWLTLKRLFPYLWDYKWRVLAALSFMVGAKMANVGVPLLLKNLVDAMNFKPGDTQAVLVVPVALLLAYGLLRLSTTLFTELRELVFAKATEGAARRISLEVFRHLHALSLRFHLERQTGGMTRRDRGLADPARRRPLRRSFHASHRRPAQGLDRQGRTVRRPRPRDLRRDLRP
jgi:ATP-binding cassette subfamily B protein